MSEKYKVGEDAMAHFITCTVVGWVDVFSRAQYKDIVISSLAHCIAHKGLRLHAYVIMTNHLHLIVSSDTHQLSDIIRDFKKYTSKQIIAAIAANDKESRKAWMLNLFAFAGRGNSANTTYQFWQHQYHPVALDTTEKLEQLLAYLHNNPVRAGLVLSAEHFTYSSAITYYHQQKGLLPITLL